MLFQRRHKKYNNLSDLDLIQLYKQEENLFTIPLLYERYGHLVLGTCLKYLKRYEDAEDATMKIFGELNQKIEKHTIQHFKSWLYQVTKNECLIHLRKQKTHQTPIHENLLQDQSHEIDEQKEREIKLTKLEQAITHLKDEQRICIELFYLQDKSYQEISEELNIPLNTVKSSIQNGKRNLKIWMESHEE
ncbi:RNA polymerase, sigma-24 subunit, ECF subfamily [Fluviicola taffensis DSM 16823]|uniref:RNA polymerase, sigma-24 subunit, ECF subfamily n=2 Tax=Fluviicola TaxID=332102 RepID=F2IDT7_FLUTR|nr:RNA polymerase, sigma-24 subunit, ECF subfamily [Fluviicola taffensis DSM 16823]